MALRLGASVTEKGALDEEHVFEKYVNWMRGPPHDTEAAFDTGATFAHVVKKAIGGHDRSAAAQQKSASAGVNSAHRCFAFAVARCIPTEQLPDVAARESRLTHIHREAVECSMVVSMICRRLLEGCDLKTSIMHGHALATVDSLKLMLTPTALRSLTEHRISPGGHGPYVVQAALYFLLNSDSFEDALLRSLGFAGIANYCPVLVGGLGGALYGDEAVTAELLEHASETLLKEVTEAADRAGDEWCT